MVSRTNPETGTEGLALRGATSYLKYFWHTCIFTVTLLVGAGNPEFPTESCKGGLTQNIVVSAKLLMNHPLPRPPRFSPVSNTEPPILSPRTTREHMPVGLFDEAILPPSAVAAPALQNKESVPNSSAQVVRQGNQVYLNGRTFPVAWSGWQMGASPGIGISDTGLMQTLGVELLNTKDVTLQPVQWFSQPTTTNYLRAILAGPYRYLDITDLAKTYGWQLQIDGDTLRIVSAPARVENIRTGRQPWGERFVVDLDRPTPWQLRQQGQEWIVTVDAVADPALIQRLNTPPSPAQVTGPKETPELKVESQENQTTLRLKIPDSLSPRISTIGNPNRLIVDVRADALVERDILARPGLRWRQEFLNLGSFRFPVVWLEINLRQPGMTLKPIWSNPTLVGTAPLLKTALMSQASAAINGGFFNRNQQLPLGAIRRDGRWLSSPILNRGAIAWNDAGQVKMGRLSFQETLITPKGERLPVVSLNSGYVQAGIARYTPEWGQTYTPLIDDEILVVVRNNQVTGQMPGGSVGKTPFPIPPDGYLLTIRDKRAAADLLAAGTNLRIESVTGPASFSQYPHILGAGPLLLQNRQIVLDAKAEKFSDAFIQEKAVRSAIGTTPSGNLIVATVHNRVAGRGPTLTEVASLMQQMGAVDALNLDGGSSTTLYLGGQLINRSPSTAARVHNGLGLFFQPSR